MSKTKRYRPMYFGFWFTWSNGYDAGVTIGFGPWQWFIGKQDKHGML